MGIKNPAAVALGKLGGQSGTGAAKQRTTSFTSESSKAALEARWGKKKRAKTKARGLRQNADLRQDAGSAAANVK